MESSSATHCEEKWEKAPNVSFDMPRKILHVGRYDALGIEDVEEHHDEEILQKLPRKSEINMVPAKRVGFNSNITNRSAQEMLKKSQCDEKPKGPLCGLVFHVTDSRRILAAVSRISEAGNTVVINDEKGRSYIKNHATGKIINMIQRNGVYIIRARVKDGDNWVDHEIVVDSGAADCVMPKNISLGTKMMDAEQGVKFAGANGNDLKNYGRRLIEFIAYDFR